VTVTAVEKNADDLTMSLTAEFDASPERVWQLWADPRQLERPDRQLRRHRLALARRPRCFCHGSVWLEECGSVESRPHSRPHCS